jgi:hypothetical protein
MAVDGVAAADIAVKLSNSAGSNKNLYTDKQTGVQNSVVGGGNVEALETVQRIEDARFIAEDIKQLKAQGLSNSQIKDNLIMAGVDPKVAGNVVNQSGGTVDNIVKSLTGASAYKDTGFFVKDFDPATVQRNLGTAPGPKVTAPTTTTPTTTTPAVTTPTVTTPDVTQTFDDGTTLTTTPGGTVVKATNPDGSTYVPGSNPALPVTTPTTTAPGTTTPGVVTPTTPPVNGETYTYDDGSTITIDKTTGAVLASTPATDTGPIIPKVTDTTATTNRTVTYDDGSTITYDANGNVVGSTNSDGTPYTPGSNPNLPSNQTGNKTVTYDDGSTITFDKDGNVIGSTNTDGTPYTPGSNPNLPINQPVTTTPAVTTPIVTPTPYIPPDRTTTPVDPYAGGPGDYSFGTVTLPNTTQGLNPGFMPGARDYVTTSPVQAQFDWSKTAYQPGPAYNPAYNAQLPPTAWGLQQMYTPMSPEQLLQLTQGTNLYKGLLPTGTGRPG